MTTMHSTRGPHGLPSKLPKVDCTSDEDPEPLPEPDSDEEDSVQTGRRTSVKSTTSFVSVVPYAEIYGVHPGSFDFSREGHRLYRDRALPPGMSRESVEFARGKKLLAEKFLQKDE